ncbi:HipA domain-containing protein [Serratia quinivorans]
MSDNHGRNTSFIKDSFSIQLAPIYDFAPMKADPEGIPRTTKWAQKLEVGGEYNYEAITAALADLVPENELMHALKTTAKQLVGLKERLQNRGVPRQIIEMPSIGFDYIPEKLKKWGLL